MTLSKMSYSFLVAFFRNFLYTQSATITKPICNMPKQHLSMNSEDLLILNNLKDHLNNVLTQKYDCDAALDLACKIALNEEVLPSVKPLLERKQALIDKLTTLKNAFTS